MRSEEEIREKLADYVTAYHLAHSYRATFETVIMAHILGLLRWVLGEE